MTGLGHKGGWIGLGEESTWGTPVSPTKFLPIVSGGDGVIVNEEHIETQAINSIGIRGDYDVHQGAVDISGPVTVEMPYDGAELLLKHAMGGVATVQPDAGGDPTVYEHTFTIADSLPVGLTAEIDRDLTAYTFEGVRINTLEFGLGGPGELLRLTAELLGEDAAIGSPSSETLPTVGKFVGHQAVLQWNATTVKCSEASIKLDNKLDGDRRFIGSRLRSQPLRNGKVEVSGSFVAEFESTALYTDFRNATTRALTLTFTGPAIGAAARTYALTLTVTVGMLKAYPVNTDSEGRMTVDVQFKAYRNASKNELEVVLQNLVTSV